MYSALLSTRKLGGANFSSSRNVASEDLPNTIVAGSKPVFMDFVLLIVLLIIKGISCQSKVGRVATIFLRRTFTVCTNLSIDPLPAGCNADVLTIFIPNALSSLRKSFDLKAAPLSV